MNVIAIMNHMGVYFKEEPIRELHQALESLDFRIVYPNDREDLLKLIENNARLCGVIFDWDKYNLELCEEISQLNEYMPLYAFANTYSTLDVSLNDLRMQVRFFEYALGAATDIAAKIKQNTDEYIDTILPPLTKALFKYVREGKYTFCTPGHMGGTAFQKSPVGSLFYDFFGPNTMKSDISISVSELGSLLDHSGPHKEAEEYISRVFNAERSYMVTNGTSTANKIVGMYSAPAERRSPRLTKSCRAFISARRSGCGWRFWRRSASAWRLSASPRCRSACRFRPCRCCSTRAISIFAFRAARAAATGCRSSLMWWASAS